MHRAKLKRTGAFVILVGVCATAAFLVYMTSMRAQNIGPQKTPSPHLAEPAAKVWEASFFSALEERTSKINLPRLKASAVAADHLEMRYWYDGSPDVINGFVIRRVNNSWSALGIRQARDRWPSAVLQENLGAPKSGWDALWKQLTDADLLVLPDEEQTKCHGQTLDGGGVVIEVLSKKTYRIYRYSNPTVVTCEEAKQMRLIDHIIVQEFNLLQGRA